jgi:ATP-dependent protease ClpP protease subunit
MSRVLIAKAQPTLRNDGPIEDIEIVIGGVGGVVSDALTMKEACAVFERHAHAICAALSASLPGGTLDRLTGLLLERKASSLRVPAP